MKDIFNLTKILLKNNFAPKNKEKGKKSAIIVYIALIIYFSSMMIGFSTMSIKALKTINQQGIFISLCLTTYIGISILRTIFTSINVLYFSKDNEFLLPLPIKSKSILIAKLNTLIIYEYIIGVFLSLIPMVVYGIIESYSIFYYIQMIIIFLLIPIVPLVLSSFVMIIIMRFTKIIKNKDFVQYISVALAIILIFAIQSITGGQTSSANLTNEELIKLLMQTNGATKIFSNVFINLPQAVNSIIYFGTIEGIKSLIIFVLETILFYVCMIEISSKIYLNGLVGVSGGNGKIKNKTIENRTFRKNKISKSYIVKEFKLLFRNPVYFMQCVLPSILFPILISIPFAININNLESLDLAGIDEIKNAIGTNFGISMILLIIEFFFIFNFVSLTAISRDGSNAVFTKYIPISLYKQCIYKIVPNIILNIIPIMYVVLICLGLLKLDIIKAIAIIVFSMLLNILQCLIMILVDLNKPKLEWTTEYAVVKQNMNMIYQMLFGTLVIILVAFSANIIKSLVVFFAISIAILLISVYSIKNYIKKNEYKLFKKII